MNVIKITNVCKEYYKSNKHKESFENNVTSGVYLK